MPTHKSLDDSEGTLAYARQLYAHRASGGSDAWVGFYGVGKKRAKMKIRCEAWRFAISRDATTAAVVEVNRKATLFDLTNKAKPTETIMGVRNLALRNSRSVRSRTPGRSWTDPAAR